MVSRDDLTCTDCNTTGLEERSRRADEFDSHQDQVIYATKCPDCGHRVDPTDIREQLSLDTDAPDSFQEQALSYLRDFSINLTTRTIGGLAGALLLISAISLGAAFGGVSVFSGDRGVSATNPTAAASGSVLTGTVENPNGTTVDDATVAVVGNSSLVTETGPNGTYQFDAVQPGSHEILVSSPDLGATSETVNVSNNASTTETITYQSTTGSDDGDESDGSDDNDDSTISESELEAESEAVIIGTVENYNDDERVNEATVTVADTDISTQTDTEGRYRLEDVPSGSVDVRVEHPEYETDTFELELDAGEVETLYPNLYPDPNTQATLLGTVEDLNGSAIENADITVTSRFEDDLLTTDTDTDGAFQFEDIPSGEVDISVTHQEYESATRTITVEPAETIPQYFELTPRPPAEWSTTVSTANSTPMWRASQRVSTPRVAPETQSVRLWSPMSTDRASINGTARGPTELSLPGNRLPTNMTLTIEGEPSQNPENTTATVAASSTNTSIPLRVNGDIPSTVTVEIVPSTNTSRANATGRLTATNDQRVIQLAGNVLPETLALTLNGRETVRNRTMRLDGDGNLSVDYRGNQPSDGQLRITSHEGGSANASFNGTLTGQETLDLSIPSFADDSVDATLTVTGNTTRGDRRTDTVANGTTFDPVGNAPPVAPANHTHPQLVINGQKDVFEMQSATAQPVGAGDSLPFETGRSAARVNYSLSQTEAIHDARVLLEGVENTTDRETAWRDLTTSTKTIDVKGSAAATVDIEITGQRGGIDTVSNTSITGDLTYGIDATAVNENPPTTNTHVTYIADGSDIHAYNQDWTNIWSNTDAVNQNITALRYDDGSESLFVATEPDVRVSGAQAQIRRLLLNPETNSVGVEETEWTGSVGNDRISELTYNDPTETVYASSERGNIYAYDLVGSGSVSPQWTQSASDAAIFNLRATGADIPLVTALDTNGTVTTLDAGFSDDTASDAQKWSQTRQPKSTGSIGFDDLDSSLNQTRDVSDTDWAVFEMAAAAGEIDSEGGGEVTALVDLRGIDSVTVYGANHSDGYRNGKPGEDSTAGDGGGSAALFADGEMLIGLGGGGGRGGTTGEVETSYGINKGATGGGGGDAIPAQGGSGGGGEVHWGSQYITNDDKPPRPGGTGDIYAADRVHILAEGQNLGRMGNLNVRSLEQAPTTLQRKHLAVNDAESILAVARTGQGIAVREANTGNLSYSINETGFDEIEDIRFIPDDSGVIVAGTRDGVPVSAAYSTTGKELYQTELTSNEVASLRPIDGGYAAIGANGQITEFETAAEPTSLSVGVNGTDLSLPSSIEEGETVSESITLPPGTKPIDISVTGAVDFTATWTDTTETINPEIEVSSAGTDSPQTYGGQSVGRIAVGNTTTLDIADSAVLGNGSITVTNVSANYTGPAGDVNATLVWNESWGTVRPEVEVGSYVNKNTSVMHGTNDSYALPNLPDEEQAVSISHAAGPAPKAHIQYVPVYQTENVSANVTGDTTTTSTNLSEPLADGETKTVELPNVTADTETITLSSPHTAAGYNVSYDYATGPRNITVTDATGEQIVHRTRPLFAGQSISANVSISGDRRFAVRADGDYNYTTNLSYQTRNGTESVTVESTGDNQPELDISDLASSETSTYTVPVEAPNVTVEAVGPVGYELNYPATAAPEDVTLTAGDTSRTLDGAVISNRTVTLRDVAVGTDKLAVDANRAGLNLRAEWTEWNGTYDPTVTYVPTGETLASVDGWLNGTRTVALTDSVFESQTPKLAFETDAGRVRWNLTMDGHAVATNATVTVNGIPTSYPGSFPANGTLPTDSSAAVERDITALSGTESVVALDSDPVDGVDTRVAAEVSYFNESAS